MLEGRHGPRLFVPSGADVITPLRQDLLARKTYTGALRRRRVTTMTTYSSRGRWRPADATRVVPRVSSPIRRVGPIPKLPRLFFLDQLLLCQHLIGPRMMGCPVGPGSSEPMVTGVVWW